MGNEVPLARGLRFKGLAGRRRRARKRKDEGWRDVSLSAAFLVLKKVEKSPLLSPNEGPDA